MGRLRRSRNSAVPNGSVQKWIIVVQDTPASLCMVSYANLQLRFHRYLCSAALSGRVKQTI